MRGKKKRIRFLIAFILVVVLVLGYTKSNPDAIKNILEGLGVSGTETYVSIDDILEYSGDPYVYVENVSSDLSDTDTWIVGYEKYTSDSIGRCGTAEALVGTETMPTSDREDISSVTPTGWVNNRYDSDTVEGGWIYNRCHLIGFQLTGENDNPDNLITGTRYMNIEGMLPFENMVDDYVDETGNHVMYRVTPIYSGNDLVASGVLMEAYSVEDSGEGIDFDVYCYNVQPGIEIDYSTGENWLAS